MEEPVDDNCPDKTALNMASAVKVEPSDVIEDLLDPDSTVESYLEATIQVKHEMSIGPIVLQPPDVHFTPRPYKTEPVEDTPVQIVATTMSELNADECKYQEAAAGVRVVTLHLPEDEGEGLGFKLTRTIWDPYPWVREVTRGQRADTAGLRSGDCLLQADGKDLLGLPVGQVAGAIRGDGGGHGVSLLVWSCGASPTDDPELLWSAGGGVRGERSRRALSGVLRALACCVCSATAASPRSRAAQCARGHLYCSGCRARLQRCALCRETLPALDSPHARNLVVEQVFEAIASVYELKDPSRLANTPSTSSSPNLSPVPSPRSPHSSVSQKNSPSCLRKTVQFGLSTQPHHGSDNSLNRPKPIMPEFSLKRLVLTSQKQTQEMDSQTDIRDLGSTSPVTENIRPFQEREKSCKTTSKCCCQNNLVSSRCGCCQTFQTCFNNRETSETAFPSARCRNRSTQNSSENLTSKCCQSSPETQNPRSCHNITSKFCHNAPESSCCQNNPENAKSKCCQTSPQSYQNVSTPKRCQSMDNPGCCQHQRSPEFLPQLFGLAHPELNLVPLSAVPGLQHRLVARLRPASSLADLRRPGSQQEGLSKSWNNIHTGESSAGERAESLDDLASPNNSAGEQLYVLSPQSPVLVWALPHQ